MRRESSLASESPSQSVGRSGRAGREEASVQLKWVTRTELGRRMKTRKCDSWPKFLCHNKIKITLNELYVYLYIYLRRLQSPFILFHAVINRACLQPLQYICSVLFKNLLFLILISATPTGLANHVNLPVLLSSAILLVRKESGNIINFVV